MAQQQRDNAPTNSDDQSIPGRNVYRPTTAPLFTSRGQREPISFANHNASRRARQAVQQQMKEERAMSIGSASSDGQAPRLSSYANSGGNNWLGSGKTGPNDRKFGLADAWQMADENQGFRPKTSEGIRRSSEDNISLLDSRIPRSKNFSPAQRMENDRPRTSPNTYQPEERDDSIMSSVIGSSGSDVSSSRQGSPSPGAKQRKDAKFRAQGISHYSDEDIHNMKGWRNKIKEHAAVTQRRKENRPPVNEDVNDEYAKIRARNAAQDVRISRIAKSTTPLFVNKNNSGHVPTRVIETARELEKKTSERYADELEPPLNIPRQWGAKAKSRPNWVQKILDPDSFVEIENLAPPGSEAMLRIAAEVPIPSIEGSSEPTPPSSRPPSAQPTYGSPEKSKLWDADVDFTATSMQISTSPLLRVRKLDQLREQEIQSLTARAVATNRLEEIRERNSEERPVLSEQPRPNLKKPTPEPTRLQPSEEPEYERTILDEEGEHIRGTPITVFSAKHYRGSSQNRDGEESGHKREDSFDLLRRLSRAASRSPAPPSRAGIMEEESAKPQEESVVKKVVERLTEKSSEQSAEKEPQAETEKVVENRHDEGSDEPAGRPAEISKQEAPLPPDVDVQNNNSKRNSRSSSRPRSEIDPEERITAEAKLFDLPDNGSQRNSIRYPSPAPSSGDVNDNDDDKFDETPKPKKQDPLSLPTPRVTGAFIETPAPTIRKTRTPRTISPYYEAGEDDALSTSVSKGNNTDDEVEIESRAGRRRRSQSSSSQEYIRPQQRAARSRPPLINSAKPTSASEDIRRIKQEAQIEDSTLEDFDALLEATVGKQMQTDDKSEILEPLLDLEYDERGIPLSKKERERRLERVILDRMNQHLKNTSSSIRDARQGIERLEHQVSSTLNMPIAHRAEDNTVYLKIPVPRLWIKDPPATTKTNEGSWYQRNWKFTWLGLILFIFGTWYITESAMCEVYCHPINSSKNTWQPTDPFFPWAIPTKLDQWTGEYVGNTLYDVWEYFDDMRGPRAGRRRWFQTPTPYGPSDWWLGRDGPMGIKYTGNEGASYFGDDEYI